jgi:hypothetical protein
MSVYYTREHEWIGIDGDAATVGITDFAQGQLGDIVFVELPAAGQQVSKGGEAAVVESSAARSSKRMRRSPKTRPWSTAIRKARAGSFASVSPTGRNWTG